MDPVVFAFIAGTLVSLVGCILVWLSVLRPKLSAHAETFASENLLALHESQPDGVYAWIAGKPPTERCSQNLKTMLQLASPADDTFTSVAGAFAASERALLKRSSEALRDAGTAFELLLPLGERTIHAVGRRALAKTETAPSPGDIIWFRDVSALVQEPLTSDAEQQMRTVFNAMPIPVWLRDPDLELAFANDRAGVAGSAVAGRATEIATRALREGGTQTEQRMLDVDGSRRVLEITESPLGPGGGTVGFAVEHKAGGASEITRALQSQRSLFEQMLDPLSVGIVMYNADKRVSYVNRAFVTLWQMDEAWLEDRPTLSQVLDRMRDTRLLPEVPDFRAYRTAENDLFQTLDTPDERTLYLPDGRTVRTTVARAGNGGITYIYEDISERLDLQRSYKTLDLVQRHTIDNLQEAVAVFGNDGRLKLHNDRFATLWALGEETTQAEPHMSRIVEHMRDDGETDEGWQTRRNHILAHLTRRQSHRERVQRLTGKVFDVAYEPLPDGAVLVSYLDVTDEATVEAALRARTEILEETNRLKSKFIDDVSYEIRTPMTTISGFSEILGAGYFGELSPRQEEYVNGIRATAETLMAVIADTLELAAIESGTVKLEKDAIDLHALLAGCMKLMTERARQKEIHLAFDVPTDIGWLSADEQRLKQVIFNLLGNAVRFTPKRGGIRLSAERTVDEVILSVADTGVGIPQADIDRVFQKFTKGDQPEGEPEGAGLGLAMVKGFLELHGGTVDIVSRPNRGTTVTCRLPATGTEGGDARDAFLP